MNIAAFHGVYNLFNGMLVELFLFVVQLNVYIYIYIYIYGDAVVVNIAHWSEDLSRFLLIISLPYIRVNFAGVYYKHDWSHS